MRWRGYADKGQDDSRKSNGSGMKSEKAQTTGKGPEAGGTGDGEAPTGGEGEAKPVGDGAQPPGSEKAEPAADKKAAPASERAATAATDRAAPASKEKATTPTIEGGAPTSKAVVLAMRCRERSITLKR